MRNRFSRSCFAPLCLLLLSACLDRTLAPLSPCLVSNVVDQRQFSRIDKVDLLFMVDNSSSMKEEQVSLEAQFPKLIQALTTGDSDGDGVRDFEPARDLHLGVVSSNLGLPNVVGFSDKSCFGFGDDGILNSRGSTEIANCKASYPPFLSYLEGTNDPAATAHDFACIAQLGTDGCGYEQQLEAPLKALWPSVDPAGLVGPGMEGVRFLGDAQPQSRLGHGDRENAGFLRDDQHGGLSLLAVIIVSDEDDCSSKSTDDIASLAPEDLNLRCFLHKEALYDTSRYAKALQALRPGHADLVLFGAIVGVPNDLVDASARKDVDFSNQVQRDAYYDRILADPRMIETPEPIVAGAMQQRGLLRSCVSAHGDAAPPRRIVQVARDFGEAGIVQSVCQDDFAPAMKAIAEAIAARLPSFCLPRKQVRNSDGKVDCDVVWDLPAESRPGVPSACGQPDFPFLLPLDASEQLAAKPGSVSCKLAQLRVIDDPAAKDQKRPADTLIDGQLYSDGWYYDDFSSERASKCHGAANAQRLAFTERAAPPNGVTARLECLDQRQSLPMQRGEPTAGGTQPTIGAACDEVERDGQSLRGDAACTVKLASASSEHPDAIDHAMFCHPKENVCVRSCAADSDCPAAWVCDQRPETLLATSSSDHPNGSAICVNPTCGTK